MKQILHHLIVRCIMKVLPGDVFATNISGDFVTKQPLPTYLEQNNIHNLSQLPNDPLIVNNHQILLEQAKTTSKAQFHAYKESNEYAYSFCLPIRLLQKQPALFVHCIIRKKKPELLLKDTQRNIKNLQAKYTRFSCQVDKDLRVLNHDANFLEACNDHRLSTNNIINELLENLLPAKLADTFYTELNLAMTADVSTAKLVELEINGTTRNYLTQFIPIKDHSGIIIGSLCTGHLQSGDKLGAPIENDNNFDELLANLPGHIYWKDLNGKILACNHEQAQSVGEKSADELYADKLESIIFAEKINPSELKQIEENDKLVIADKEAIMFEESITINKQTKTYLSKKSPLILDGQCIGSAGVSLDISEYKQREKHLTHVINDLQKNLKRLTQESHRTQSYLEQIVSNLPGNVFWEDRDGNFIGCNDHLIEWLGLESKDDLLQKNLLDLISVLGMSQEMQLEIRKNDLQVLTDKKTLRFEEKVTKDGRTLYFLSQKSPLIIDNECVGLIGVAFDITEQKELEAQLQEAKQSAEDAHKAKSDFIANISHDLRTPLHTLLGTTEQLQLESNENCGKLKVIQQCGYILSRLVENVLHFSRLQEGNLELTLTSFDICDLIESLLATFQPIAKEKNIKLQLQLTDIQHPHVLTDANALSRILINLVQNAIKFTEDGKIVITLKETLLDNNQRPQYKLSVTDTGIGIATDDLPHIFDRFYQNDAQKRHGMGMGLAITRRFVELMNGSIDVETQHGVGTTFTCEFCFDINEPDKLKQESIDDKNTPLDGLNVLLVEDNPLVQRMTLHTLNNFGCATTLAKDGSQAITNWKNNEFGLIFIDLGLPDISGLEVIKTIRRTDSKTPIIALTAHVNDQLKADCLNAGANDFIAKPASHQNILQRIKANVIQRKT